MYCIENMIDMGLRKNEEWTSPEHREVAILMCIANPLIRDRDALYDNCGKINSVPNDRIKTISTLELINEFSVLKIFTSFGE